MKILQILEASEQKHMSAEDIYKALIEEGEEVGLATVYRVLTQFATAGLVVRHYFDGTSAVYELNRGDHHDHMVCLRTGKVVEFYDEVIEKRQAELASEHGFKIHDHSLILYGEFDEADE